MFEHYLSNKNKRATVAPKSKFTQLNKGLARVQFHPKSQKVLQYLSHRMFAACAWSIKCRRKEKLIAQFGGKLRDERFEPS